MHTYLIRTLVAVFAVLAAANLPASGQAAVGAQSKTIAVSVPLASWSSSNGQEFPGATVKCTVDTNGPTPGASELTLAGDFTGGGAYCCVGRNVNDLQFDNLRSVDMLVKSSNVSTINVRVVDGTGQTLQAKGIAISDDGMWHTLSIKPEALVGGEHWGGANDGQWHAPLAEFYILIGPTSGPSKMPSVSIANVNLITSAPPQPTTVHAIAIKPIAGLGTDKVSARDDQSFLNSIGANSAIERRGEDLADTIKCAQYVGIRWFRSDGGIPVQSFSAAYQEAGIRFDLCIGSSGSDINQLISTADKMQSVCPGALLSFEGPNEPNNWGITYEGQAGGRDGTWLPLAKMQAEMYRRVKSDPQLKEIAVWGISENGAEVDNVGLQYLTIPNGAACLMPDGTKYADYANVHNYIYHSNSPNVEDNKTWNSSDPTSACKVDGLYGEYGVTWGHHYSGYSGKDLVTLPRVTTETGTTIGGDVTESIHALNILSLYLDQFKRGWSYTALYLLRDRVDEAGNQKFGLYRPNYTPRLAAVYLHNLTTILADRSSNPHPGSLAYKVIDEPATVHDLLLQKSDGTMVLAVWDEKVQGSDTVAIDLGQLQQSLEIFDPTAGTSPVEQLSKVRSIELTLTDHPALIDLASTKGN